MKLPQAELATAPAAKVRDYLLNPGHRTGGPKCAFFVSFGFDRQNWEALAVALCNHAREHDVAGTAESRFGVLYRVEGPVSAPDGRNPHIRSIWFIATDDPAPRLATAYPLEPSVPERTINA